MSWEQFFCETALSSWRGKDSRDMSKRFSVIRESLFSTRNRIFLSQSWILTLRELLLSPRFETRAVWIGDSTHLKFSTSRQKVSKSVFRIRCGWMHRRDSQSCRLRLNRFRARNRELTSSWNWRIMSERWRNQNLCQFASSLQFQSTDPAKSVIKFAT